MEAVQWRELFVKYRQTVEEGKLLKRLIGSACSLSMESNNLIKEILYSPVVSSRR
jgi:hypothetical protein